ncbi:DUF1648 domain-containing protein [Psychroserpens sp. Hel_I_66]|uniref:DUF1648 domain-containing protein n=1 Tax=Psychroserpens sp. Hel_I_66 TaxID=1250004 RepID=UPI00068DDC2B|nr:DUF1648 domain-containing protein [Psychroserpens sp. Hel_I_66]
MKTNRPKIKVPLQPLDIVLDLISATLILITIIYTAMNYGDLAETIPTHFNAAGEADGYGSKSMIWMLPVIGVFTFLLLFFLNKYPHIHNYMVNITEENALKNYRFSTRIIRFTNLFVAILFLVIQYMMIEEGKGNNVSFGSWFTYSIIGASLILPIFILIYQQKINKS